ncbi:GNAT family N-acetyltransferase [uncultured Enterococcus sp.]|uniref:GNAT family N-acetyltransferase n=1 Tax=uncultured Enterococcus sp. TaxID=167972 RepID=UPI00262A8E27|nr:GNAT family N-acetyltransferase [uncultured Enterococcus sp.]
MKIRVAQIEDAARLVEIYRPYVEKTAITFEYKVPSVTEFEQRMIKTLKKYPYLVLENERGKIVGYAYAGTYKGRTAYDWSVEVTVYLDQAKQGRGYGELLYTALEAYLSKQHIYQLTACITAGNGASEHFHEKLGYRKVAHFEKIGYKFGQWYDICWMQKTLGDLPSQPAAFIPFSKL